MALTELFLKSNHGKPREKTEEYTDRDSMSVRISPKGKIVFQYRYRFNAKPVRLDLGTYPELTLKMARAKLLEMRALLNEGKNPKLEVNLRKQHYQTMPLLSEIFMQWYHAYCVKEKKTAEQVLATFKLHVFPPLGNLPLNKISVKQWLDLLENLKDDKPAITERILVNAKQMLKWAKKREIIENNPLSDIYAKADLNIQKRKTDRVLSDDDVKMLFIAMTQSNIYHRNRLFLELCLMYGCRNGELRLAKKSDFDFDKKIWTVPVEINKVGKVTGRKITRPILPEMEDLLREAMQLNKSMYLFANDEGQPISRSVTLSLPYNLMQFLRSKYNYNMQHWSMHDLRRTARTNFSAFTRRDIAEVMLGHSLRGEQATYDYYEYLPEQTEAYAKWIEKLKQLKS